MERKATDVLLDLEKKVDLILGYLKTIDLNNKLILNKLNKKAKSAAITVESTSVALPKVEAFLDPQVLVNLEKRSKEESLTFPTVSESNLTEKPIITKKVSVNQKVLYPDDKGVILANVEIYNLNQELVKKTRTNNVGKWATTLDPGKYKIHVYKTGTPEKPAVESQFEIDIPYTESVINLNTIK